VGLLDPVFNAPGKRGCRHADDLRSVADAILNIAQTGCQWRYLPESFGPWTRVWSQFRRWSRKGTWAQALTVLHAVAPTGRKGGGRRSRRSSSTPTSLAVPRTAGSRSTTGVGATAAPGREACRGRRRHRSSGAAVVVPASTHGNRASDLMLEHLTQQGVTDRLELVLLVRGVTAAASRDLGREATSRSVGSGGTTRSRSSALSGTPGVSRSPAAASDAPVDRRSRSRTPPPQRPAGSKSRASVPLCGNSLGDRRRRRPAAVAARPPAAGPRELRAMWCSTSPSGRTFA